MVKINLLDCWKEKGNEERSPVLKLHSLLTHPPAPDTKESHGCWRSLSVKHKELLCFLAFAQMTDAVIFHGRTVSILCNEIRKLYFLSWNFMHESRLVKSHFAQNANQTPRQCIWSRHWHAARCSLHEMRDCHTVPFCAGNCFSVTQCSPGASNVLWRVHFVHSVVNECGNDIVILFHLLHSHCLYAMVGDAFHSTVHLCPKVLLGSLNAFHARKASLWHKMRFTFTKNHLIQTASVTLLNSPNITCSAHSDELILHTAQVLCLQHRKHHTDWWADSCFSLYLLSSPLFLCGAANLLLSDQLRLSPGKHQNAVMNPFVHTSRFCLCCQATQRKCQRLLLVFHTVMMYVATVNLLTANYPSSATNTQCRM